MESEWNDPQRVSAIQIALNTLPHNQIAVGIGFKLTHDPTRCVRCRAEISLMELAGKLNQEVSENVA